MNLQDIYNRAVWHVFGTETPPTTDTTLMQAVGEGIIANIHRKIQEDFNFWFMLESFSYDFSQYENSMSLPERFKCETNPVRIILYDSDNTITSGTVTCSGTTAVTGTGTSFDPSWTGLRYRISFDSGATWHIIKSVASATSLTLEDNGDVVTDGAYIIERVMGIYELRKCTPGEAQKVAYDMSGYGTPCLYDIKNGYLNIYPMPNYAGRLEFNYYRYLPRPTLFATHTDSLTEEAGDLLVYLTVAEWGASQMDADKLSLYMQKAAGELETLKKRHWEYSNNNFTIPYTGEF